MRRRLHTTFSALCALALAAGTLPVHAADAGLWQTVSNHTLDQQRGGFDLGGGLVVSLGIARAVYINGNLVTQTSLDFGQINKLTPAQAAQLSQQMSTLNLVQNGPGNVVTPDAGLGTTYGTVIQNTLNNQHITSQTVINATSNAAGFVKSLNLQDTLGSGLNSAIPGH